MVKNKKVKLVYVGFAFEHHKGTHAGYQHIREYAGYDSCIDCQDYFERLHTPPSNVISKIYRRLLRLIFGYPVFPIFLFKMILMSLNCECIFHVIYGENLYTPRMRFLFNNSKVVCTFHQPFDWFDNKVWKKNLQHIDGMILLSDKEINQFRQAAKNDKVVYIPHGVFTDFYTPNKHSEKENMLLTVGNWLRDYDLADKVYTEFLRSHKDWQITIVANKESTKNIHKDQRIHCKTGISDGELRDLYQRCKVLFLPLVRYTANNALLEAASCGCDIIISSNTKDNSYIPPQYLDTIPMDITTILSRLEDRISHSADTHALVDYVRMHYSWNLIGKKVHHFLISFVE